MAARRRPISAPCQRVGDGGAPPPRMAKPIFEEVTAGSPSSHLKEMRERLVEQAVDCSTKKVLERALEEERAQPRAWFKRHHLTVGVANAVYPPDSREYFDAPRPVELDIDDFAAEFLHGCRTQGKDLTQRVLDGPPRWLQDSVQGQGNGRRARPWSACSAPVLGDARRSFAWRAPEEEAIAQAIHRVERQAVKKTELSATTRNADRTGSIPGAAKGNARAEDQALECLRKCWHRQQERHWSQQQEPGNPPESRRSPCEGARSASSRAARRTMPEASSRLQTAYSRHAAAVRETSRRTVTTRRSQCRPTTLKVPTSASELRRK